MSSKTAGKILDAVRKMRGAAYASRERLLHERKTQLQGEAAGTELKYLFYEGSDTTHLLIVFSSCTREGIKGRYNYVRTLKNINCPKLFILDDRGPGSRGDYYWGSHDAKGQTAKAVRQLVSLIKSRYPGIKPVYCGSSKGGWAALYYGFNDSGCSMIVGAPQYYLGSYCLREFEQLSGNHSLLPYLCGKGEDVSESVKELDRLIADEIQELQYPESIKLFLNYSNREHTYAEHIQPLIRDCRRKGVSITATVDSYNEHGQISKYFPTFLLSSVREVLEID